MNLGDFIDTFKDVIAQRVVESYPPLYRPSGNGGTLPRLLRKPLGAQADAIRGVVEGDGGVEAASAVELHLGPERIDAGGHRGGESVDGGHRVHSADEQREPLPGRGVDQSEGVSKPRTPAALRMPLAVRWYLLARRQVGGPVAHAPDNALGQQGGQGAVDRRVRLAEDACQLRRIDEWRPAEGVEHLLFGHGHSSSVAIEGTGGQPSHDNAGTEEGSGIVSGDR